MSGLISFRFALSLKIEQLLQEASVYLKICSADCKCQHIGLESTRIELLFSTTDYGTGSIMGQIAESNKLALQLSYSKRLSELLNHKLSKIRDYEANEDDREFVEKRCALYLATIDYHYPRLMG